MQSLETGLIIFNQRDGEGEPGRGDHVIAQTTRPALKRPSLYRVVMLNDDFTPMDFVVEVLMTFFGLTEERSTQVMLTVHTEGKAICGVYTRDIAETKVAQVNQYSSECQHPLMCELERAD